MLLILDMRWQVSHSNKEEGLIQAKTRSSMATLGDLVTVFIVDEGDYVTVDMTSSSSQQYDWGKNNKNMAQFFERLNSELTKK